MVKVDKLVKRYKDKLAVDNLSFHIPEGKVVGLLGPNGAGKTSTIHAIMGLINYDQGDIEIFGLSPKKHEIEIKKGIGFVPQNICVYSDLSVEENLIFFGKLYGLKKKALKESVQNVLDDIGLNDRKKDKAHTLSGGMLRRLNIGCAMVHSPKLLIMDEPTVGIDAKNRNELLKVIKSLNDKGKTIIYTSHYMHEVEYLCDEIIIMDEGRVIASGDLGELRNMITDESVLSISLRHGDQPLDDDLSSLKGIQAIDRQESVYKIVYQPELASKSDILRHFLDAGSEIHEISDDKPSLEDVFLTMTGKSLAG